MVEATDPVRLALTPTAQHDPGAQPTHAPLYQYSVPNSVSLQTLADIGDTLNSRPKIFRYIASANSKEVRNARSGR